MVAKNRPLEAVKDTDETPAKPAAKSAATKDITLPALSTFDKVVTPEIVKSFERPVKKDPTAEPRVFSAKGEKAEACARVIFAEQGFTRQQIEPIRKLATGRPRAASQSRAV